MLSIEQERIKQLVDDLGITQKEFAARAGIRREIVCRYINGTRNPSLQTLAKIAATYNINPAWLLGYSEEVYDEK